MVIDWLGNVIGDTGAAGSGPTADAAEACVWMDGFDSRLLAGEIPLTQSRVAGFLFQGFSLKAGLAGLMTV